MERIEYRNVIDKTDWKRGPWNDEPDKIQWQDAETGLACLIVRGPVGALCGYVGVPAGHPFHGLDYGSCPQSCGGDYCDHRPESSLDAHGGITFASGCSDLSRDRWEKWRSRKPELERDAKKYPSGDAAQSLKEWTGCFDNYEAWAERGHARFICHTPGPGEPDNTWWFGFDCAHAGDICPSMSRLGLRSMSGDYGEVYRDIDYVTAECQKLAKQLAARR
ncbi:hypothetical protein [Rhodoplanes sp. Z2-YC6860]|uniref:hypothetical protein n=1 Tax=Rhodoplanes sp. Z2-YC6860 TaxID=674703 RepID=UPI00078C3710|nr:hypothetical protein [Rhodoplanes sp. Z2-YC6860]AMN41092.1 hypothetical protein RHPLAN_26540 [Rhodoplanes sp. Z2-YC6860]